MDQTEEIVFTPHPGQVKILTSQKRFLLAIAGIQGGKTFCGCIWVQLEIEKYPTKNHLICALSQDQLNNVVIDKFFTWFPGYKMYYVKKDKTVYLPTGGKIFFRSLEDPKYVEGITAHSAWIDEADLCGYKAYTVVRGRLNATGGRLLMTSSLSENSWLSEYMERFAEGEFEIVNWKSKENPAFSDEEWESLKKEMDPVLFRKRYEADLNFNSGRVYGGFDKERHSPFQVPLDDPIERYFIGIDWGYVDPTAIILIGLSYKKNVYIISDFVVEGAPIDLICLAIDKYRRDFNVRMIYADPSNKSMLQSVNTRIKAGIIAGNRDIFSGTSTIRNLIFQNRFFVLQNCKHVLREIRAYSFIRGLVNMTEEPEDKNNHTLDAIRYVLATYPIPTVRYKKNSEKEEVPDFWLRRTAAYQREAKKHRAYIPEDRIMP